MKVLLDLLDRIQNNITNKDHKVIKKVLITQIKLQNTQDKKLMITLSLPTQDLNFNKNLLDLKETLLFSRLIRLHKD